MVVTIRAKPLVKTHVQPIVPVVPNKNISHQIADTRVTVFILLFNNLIPRLCGFQKTKTLQNLWMLKVKVIWILPILVENL